MIQNQEFIIPGQGETSSLWCNQVYEVDYCQDCGKYEARFYHCNSWSCPECYFWTAARAARRLEERLEGVQKAYSFIGKFPGRVAHVVFSVPPTEYKNFDYKAARKKLIKYCKQIGISGGSVVFHPYRVKNEFRAKLLRVLKNEGTPGGIWRAVHENRLNLGSWREYVDFAPHFHVLGFYPKVLVKSDTFFKVTGWTYKAIDIKNTRNVYRTARYILTHHAVLEGHNVVYFGIASYSKTSVTKEKKYEAVKCPKCGSENHYRLQCGEERFKRFLEGSERPDENELFAHVRICKMTKRYFVKLITAGIAEGMKSSAT